MMQHNNTANTHRSLYYICALAIVFTSTKWGRCSLIRVCSLIRSNTVCHICPGREEGQAEIAALRFSDCHDIVQFQQVHMSRLKIRQSSVSALGIFPRVLRPALTVLRPARTPLRPKLHSALPGY